MKKWIKNTTSLIILLIGMAIMHSDNMGNNMAYGCPPAPPPCAQHTDSSWANCGRGPKVAL